LYSASLHRLLIQAEIEDLHRAPQTFNRSDDSAEASEIDLLKMSRLSTYLNRPVKSVFDHAASATREEAQQTGSRNPATTWLRPRPAILSTPPVTACAASGRISNANGSQDLRPRTAAALSATKHGAACELLLGARVDIEAGLAPRPGASLLLANFGNASSPRAYAIARFCTPSPPPCIRR
jgi:hypothetical protein